LWKATSFDVITRNQPTIVIPDVTPPLSSYLEGRKIKIAEVTGGVPPNRHQHCPSIQPTFISVRRGDAMDRLNMEEMGLGPYPWGVRVIDRPSGCFKSRFCQRLVCVLS
jgi:hypothetical protein